MLRRFKQLIFGGGRDEDEEYDRNVKNYDQSSNNDVSDDDGEVDFGATNLSIPAKKRKRVTFMTDNNNIKRQSRNSVKVKKQRRRQQTSAQLIIQSDDGENDSMQEESEPSVEIIDNQIEEEGDDGSYVDSQQNSDEEDAESDSQDVVVNQFDDESEVDSEQEQTKSKLLRKISNKRTQKQALKLLAKQQNQNLQLINTSGNFVNNPENQNTGTKVIKSQKQAKKLLEDTSVSMRSLKRSIDSSFKNVDELNCPICMDYIISSRTAVCGHSFCEICIHESLIHKKECPNCRKDIRKWVLGKSDIIDSAVKLMVKGKGQADQSELKRYEERVKYHLDWKDKQTVKEVKPGDRVDALDTEYIWCKAQVELKIRAKNRRPLLYLHYDGWSRKYDEYIYIDSRRIAPYGLFTSRVDIPRYQSTGGNRGQPMNYAQVIDSARNIQLNQDQIENEGERDGQIDDPHVNQVDDMQEDNEASVDSLFQNVANNGPRDEHQESNSHQRQGGIENSAATGASGGGGNPATSLNRDSNLGRGIEGGTSSQSTLQITGRRPITAGRSTRPTNWTFTTSDPISRSNILRNSHQSSNPFRQRPNLSGNDNRLGHPLPVSRQRSQQREANTTTRNPFTAANRAATSPFQQRSTLFGRTGNQQQNNSGDAPATASGVSALANPFTFPSVGSSSSLQPVRQTTGAETSRPQLGRADFTDGAANGASSFDRPNQQRRLSVPSNTGNIMRGSGQSNIFGATAATNTSSGVNENFFNGPPSATGQTTSPQAIRNTTNSSNNVFTLTGVCYAPTGTTPTAGSRAQTGGSVSRQAQRPVLNEYRSRGYPLQSQQPSRHLPAIGSNSGNNNNNTNLGRVASTANTGVNMTQTSIQANNNNGGMEGGISSEIIGRARQNASSGLGPQHQNNAASISVTTATIQQVHADENSSAAAMLSQLEAPTVSEVQAPSQTGQEGGEGGGMLQEVVESQAMVVDLDNQSQTNGNHHAAETGNNNEAEMLAMVNEIVDEEEDQHTLEAIALSQIVDEDVQAGQQQQQANGSSTSQVVQMQAQQPSPVNNASNDSRVDQNEDERSNTNTDSKRQNKE